MVAVSAISQSSSEGSSSGNTPPARSESLNKLLRYGLIGTWDDNAYGVHFEDPLIAGELLSEPGLLWEAVLNDAAEKGISPEEYIAAVKELINNFNPPANAGKPQKLANYAASRFLKSLGTDDGKGKLWLLSGPRCLGKSLILQTMAQELNAIGKYSVLYVDVKRHRNKLVEGLVYEIAKDEKKLEGVIEKVPPAMAKGLLNLICRVAPFTVNHYLYISK